MTNQCEHGQLGRQCDLCEKEEALSVAWSVLEGQRQQIADLTAKLAEAERDAERYRWLRDKGGATWVPFVDQWRMPAHRCDSQVDAARQEAANGP